jgi:Chain length determinant protein
VTTPTMRIGRRRALLLSLGALALTLLLPVIGLVFGIFTLVVSARSKAVVGIVVSTVVVMMAVGMTATQFYFGDELSAYNECKKGAGTVSAQQECVDGLERAMEAKLPFLAPGELRFPFAP